MCVFMPASEARMKVKTKIHDTFARDISEARVTVKASIEFAISECRKSTTLHFGLYDVKKPTDDLLLSVYAPVIDELKSLGYDVFGIAHNKQLILSIEW